MSIKPPGSMTAANCTACSWIANTAKSTGNALVAGATKVANFVSSAFQTLAQYASSIFGHTKNGAIAAMNAMKANPQMAIGGLAVATLAAAALYAYKQRATV